MTTPLIDTSGDSLDIKARRGTDVSIEIECMDATDPENIVDADLTGYTADASATAAGHDAVELDVDITDNVVTLTISQATMATMTGPEWSYGVFTTVGGERSALVSGRLVLKPEYGG